MREVIERTLEIFSEELESQFNTYKLNATGNTLRSVAVTKLTDKEGEVSASEHIFTLVYGRGPTKKEGSGGKSLVEAIDEWIEAKGLSLNKYAVAKKIHKEGTALFRGNHTTMGAPPTDLINKPREKAMAFFREHTRIALSERLMEKIRRVAA